VQQIDPFLELLQPCGIDLEPVGIRGEFALQFLKICDGLLVQGKERSGRGIDFSKVEKRSSQASRLSQERRIFFGQNE